MLEYLFLSLVVFGSNGLGIFYLKSLFDEIKKDNKEFSVKFDRELQIRNECQKQLPLLYAGNGSTQVKIDNHEVRISKLERDLFNIKDKCESLKKA
jgi:predicted nuclease with TOPRIM domain